MLHKKSDNYLKGIYDTGHNKASHIVYIKNGLAFKFLNLLKSEKTEVSDDEPEKTKVSDDEPETEMICASIYHALGIPKLIAQTALVEIEGLGLVQISEAIEGTNLNENSTIGELDPHDTGKQYLMSLFLSFGDAKSDNFKLFGNVPVAIDTEMAFRSPIRYCEDRGAIAGNYSILFKGDMKNKIHPDVRNVILALDSDQVVRDWQQKMSIRDYILICLLRELVM